jgi:RHS repeat-associated protein
MRETRCFFSLLTVSLLAVFVVHGQDVTPAAVTDQNRTGDLPYSTVIGTETEHVVVTSGDLTVNIPIAHVKGRAGLDFDFGLRYDGRIYAVSGVVGSNATWRFENHNYVPAAGIWQTNQPTLSFLRSSRNTCGLGGGGGTLDTAVDYNGYMLQDSDGTKHPLNIMQEGGTCDTGTWQYANSGPATDGSGIWAQFASPGDTLPSVRTADGKQFAWLSSSVTQDHGALYIGGLYIDPNGNSDQDTPAGLDTLGRSLLTQQNGTNQILYTVKDSSGTARTYTVTYTTLTLNSSFGISGVHELGGTRAAISSIALPNGSAYSFGYDSGGELTSLTLPTGAVITYTWASFATPPLLQFSYRYVSSRSVRIGGVTSTWSFSQQTVSTSDCTGFTSGLQTTVTDPLGNQTVYLSALGNPCSIKTYSGAATGTPVRTYKTAYSNLNDSTRLPTSITTQLENGLVSQKVFAYDALTYPYSYCPTDQICGDTGPVVASSSGSRGNVTDIWEYDFASGSPGPLLRHTAKTYLHDSNSAYVPYNIVGKVLQDAVYNGAGNQIAQTQYDYDNYVAGDNPLQSATNAAQHDDTNFSSTFIYRGNLTRAKRWRNTDGALLTTTYSYDILGNIRAIKDPLGHTASYDYTDSFANTACPPATGKTGQAYFSQVTNALNQSITKTYNSCSGTLASGKDPNNLTTSHTYDMMHRRTQSNFPDVGQDTACFSEVSGSTCYSASLPLSATRTQKISPTLTRTSKSIADDLGRVIQTQLSDPQGTVLTDTTYDALGRVATVSNPYRQGIDPTTSAGTTSYFYDPLGRKCLEVPPDGTLPTGGVCPATQPANTIFTTYSGNSTTVTDQTGKSRKSVTDGLGRLTQVFEDPAGLNYETDYAYDALGNLLTVNQKGATTDTTKWRTRTFTFDSLSRLLTSYNPEVGTITYKYDADTNCASPNSFAGLLVSKTDARGIRTCYQYDALNREVVQNYSNGDPTITTAYDQAACLGLTACQNIGHRTSMTDAAGSESWAYQVDTTNFPNSPNIHRDQRTTNGITKSSTYYADLAGNVTQAVYPTSRIVNYTFDSANRPSTAIDGSNGITYATDFQTAPTGCLTGKACYTPQGSFYALSIGQTASFTGLNLTHSYNSRLQPNEFKASSTGGNAIDITYGFVDPVTSHNAGHVYSINNNLNSSRTQNFTYDQLNRIKTAGTSATTGQYCWGYDYSSSYDAWGNLQSQPGGATYTGCSEYLPPAMTADGNNHLSGFSYDLSGNTQSDGVNAYAWDGESQLKSATSNGITTNYFYDGDGRRVSKVGGKLYWYGSGGDILAETDASGNMTAEYVFFGGKRVAQVPASGNPIYYVEDLLGTSRVITTNTGVVCYDADFYPYGGERSYTNTCPQNYKFEGKERDTETGNDDFGARYYSNRFGRWLSADWSAVPVPVPYANLTNPQTLNLYAMVADDPESFADLDGHCPDGVDCSGNYSANQPPTFSQVGQFLVGVGKELVNMVTSTANSLLLSEGGGAVPSGLEIPRLQGSNFIQQAGMGATQGTVAVTAVVETGGAAVDAVAGRLAEAAVPDANVVVRGGQGELPASGTYSGAHGATLEDAASGVQHGTIRESTAGEIRNAGGSVKSKPEPSYPGGPINEKHVNIQGGQKTFGPPRNNPVPRSQRPPSAPKPPKPHKKPNE